ncbi:lycopene cyclase domain-containing protein [Occultella glacieicola]|uniref:Lycopene cyclase domain-containing protein n=1 Tax=Occultella glacieicola TaxID=2518684 RepID=A0ABY2E8F1_9MICO|nr:lycopene cyclase domain-containing protein [Occultella glacieicola]TDE98790.1 lycopene cyclase domain-containing protein [Occultella glacieicola]
MTYTAICALAVLAAIVLDRWVLRTRLTTSTVWWSAYGIIVFFQLLTNGWLTGRGIVRYDPDTILGSGDIRLFGDGRLVYAPVEDLAFGFGLVLTSCAVWVWLGARRNEATEEDVT